MSCSITSTAIAPRSSAATAQTRSNAPAPTPQATLPPYNPKANVIFFIDYGTWPHQIRHRRIRPGTALPSRRRLARAARPPPPRQANHHRSPPTMISISRPPPAADASWTTSWPTRPSSKAPPTRSATPPSSAAPSCATDHDTTGGRPRIVAVGLLAKASPGHHRPRSRCPLLGQSAPLPRLRRPRVARRTSHCDRRISRRRRTASCRT